MYQLCISLNASIRQLLLPNCRDMNHCFSVADRDTPSDVVKLSPRINPFRFTSLLYFSSPSMDLTGRATAYGSGGRKYTPCRPCVSAAFLEAVARWNLAASRRCLRRCHFGSSTLGSHRLLLREVWHPQWAVRPYASTPGSSPGSKTWRLERQQARLHARDAPLHCAGDDIQFFRH